MADTVEALPAHSNAIYPWDKWSDGQVWRVRRGVDFHVAARSFRSAMSFAASRRGMVARSRTSKDGKTIHFQFEKKLVSE